ncbi:hypothetical protein FRC19_005721 [Serendipita sp. 401]|nr:hypothetical protein FRC15_008999 [Serendipita sp. 397]KAG8808691.1 hypothetical protein FRC19_005721 [Serendipita sp. 401]KAG8873446.1 hypothetical protein FRC20_007989 [Serendipita sp. 405]
MTMLPPVSTRLDPILYLSDPQLELVPSLKRKGGGISFQRVDRMATQTEFVLPERYTFSKYGQPMSKAALDMIEDLMKEANNCDSDAHDMYICNDYLGYAVLNIVNRVIDSVSRKATKKQWIESWDALTALAIFIDTFPDFMNIDDGELVIAADKVFGALVVKVLKGICGKRRVRVSGLGILSSSDGQCRREFERVRRWTIHADYQKLCETFVWTMNGGGTRGSCRTDQASIPKVLQGSPEG